MTKQPLRSRNFAPSAALAPYIARHYVFDFEAPDDFEIVDAMLCETAFVRLLLRGDWKAKRPSGEWLSFGNAIFCGPNSRPLHVKVRGGFRVVGIALCPAGWGAFTKVPASQAADQIMPITGFWGERAEAFFRDIASIGDDAGSDGTVVAAIERHMTALLDARGWPEPDKAMQRFELIARANSTALVRDVAAELGISARNLERRCQATFGFSPKAVLRRSRFLDMAAAIRALSRPEEQEAAALRYYDQPQLIREFRHFIGMTPRQFERTPTPLLTASLELRELRKIEDAANGVAVCPA